MTAREIIERASISHVYKTLHGDSYGIEAPPIRGRRAVAFWRQGDGYNIALNDQTNTWYDHARSEGGGILQLIQTIRACSMQEALHWLADLYDLPLSSGPYPSSRRCERKSRARAGADARKIYAWRRDCLAALRCARAMYFHAYHRSLRYIINSGLEAPSGALAADLHEICQQRYEELGQAIERINRATFSDLKSAFRRLRREETVHV